MGKHLSIVVWILGSQLMLKSTLFTSLLSSTSWISHMIDTSLCTHSCVHPSTLGTPRSALSSLGSRAGPCWDSWCPHWIKLPSLKGNSGHTTFQTRFILHFLKADFGPADHNNLSCHLPAAVHKQNWSAKYSHWENRERCECKEKKLIAVLSFCLSYSKYCFQYTLAFNKTMLKKRRRKTHMTF